MMEAAEILTAFTAPSMYSVDTQSPVSQEAYCHTDPWSNSMALDDQEWTGADEEWAVPEFTVGASRPAARGKPAPKPRKKAAAAGGGARQPGKARKVADKRNTTHVSAPMLSVSASLQSPLHHASCLVGRCTNMSPLGSATCRHTVYNLRHLNGHLAHLPDQWLTSCLSCCLQFQDEANHCCPETVATLKAAWAATESIPVTCVNTSTGTRAEGTFKIIDGKKRIVFSGPTPYAAEGTIMEPVEFEKAGDRGSTRNWQLSITVAGKHRHVRAAADLPSALAHARLLYVQLL
jgi:hypothetical protein